MMLKRSKSEPDPPFPRGSGGHSKAAPSNSFTRLALTALQK